MVNQLKVNGKLQDVIITKNYKENELFKKLNKKLPYTVLEYLVVNGYKYEDVKKHLHNIHYTEEDRIKKQLDHLIMPF